MDILIGQDRVDALKEELRAFLNHWPEPQPAFEFTVGWSSTYDQLFREDYDRGTTGTENILDKTLGTGRVLISGRAGAAKTTILYRLLRNMLADPEAVPILIDMKSWAPHAERWAHVAEDFSYRMDFLLSTVARPKTNLAFFDSIDPSILRAILIDGLNEVTPTVAQQIITTVDEYIRRAADSVVIATDRVVRRTLINPKNWNLCALQPLAAEEVRRHLQPFPEKLRAYEASRHEHRQLFQTPLFLNQFLQATVAPQAGLLLLTTDGGLSYYFQQQIGLTDAEMTAVSAAAFEMYRTQKSRSFVLSEFRVLAGSDAAAKLEGSTLRMIDDDRAYFDHHLHHDYLASRYLVGHDNLWNHAGFDAITFKAASFDALALALQQLKAPDPADRFIQALYDWNVYAPAYVLSEAYYGGAVSVSAAMQTVLSAMVAEKRWDFVLPTRQFAKDALSVFPAGSIARRFLELASLADLISEVRALTVECQRFQIWQRVFSLGADEEVAEGLFEEISSDDSIIGWTLANVLKRTKVNEARQERLRSIAARNDQSVPVCWRIVHVLGRWPTAQNVSLLIRFLDHHTAFWVRYGSLRSLIELAGRSGDGALRSKVFSALQQRAPQIIEKRMAGELRRALFVSDAPPAWSAAATGLIIALYAAEKDEEQRTSWLKVEQKIIKEYGNTQQAIV